MIVPQPASRRLRVVQVCADTGIAPGSTKGAAQHLRGLAAGLANQGHCVTTFAARPPEGPFPVPLHPLTDLTMHRLASADVVYERYSLGHRMAFDMAAACQVPFALEVNSPLVDEARTHRVGTVEDGDAAIESALLAGADLVIAVSRDLARWAQARRIGRTVTISNGFEPSWFSAVAARAIDDPLLVFLGHPKPWHGADRLVELLVDLIPLGFRPKLRIIGGGPGAETVRAQAVAAGVASQVEITGAVRPERASALLADATIGLAPYPQLDHFYFCPLKIVDYLAAGLAIVSTDQGDIGTLVGDAGTLVRPSDRAGLAVAVAQLLADPARCSQLGRRGRERAFGSMTWDHVAQATIDALGPTPAARAMPA